MNWFLIKEYLRTEKVLNIAILVVLGMTLYFRAIWDIDSHRFIRDNVQYTYIYSTGLLMFIALMSAFSKKLNRYRLKLYFLISALLMTFGFAIFASAADILNIPIYYIFQIHFVQTILTHDNSPFYLIGFTIISSVILALRLFWKSAKKDDVDKSVQQIIQYGLLVYMILIPTIWIFTHFTYVTSNFFYMNASSNMVNTILAEEKTELYNDKFKEFQNFQDMFKFYEDKYGADEHQWVTLRTYLYDFLQSYEKDFNYDGMHYYDVVDFEDWVDFTLNQRHMGYLPEDKIFYFYHLFIPEKYNDIPLSHLIFSVKIQDDGTLISYLNFDPEFKKLKKNYLFNIIYIIFHIVFIAFWLWLIRIHFKLKK